MAAGLPRGQYVEALGRAVAAATRDFTPDLVLISAGFDCLAGDPLGGFTLEPEDLAGVTRDLVTAAEAWCGGRLAVALEGGYDPQRVGDAAAAVMRALR
jgi:acetoin utilization deacetylase AcuC-like enzyme